MIIYKYWKTNQSEAIQKKAGILGGLMANSGTPTATLIDGFEKGTAASSIFTISGAITPATRAQSGLTSSGAMVAGSHAKTTLTITGQMLDSVKATQVLTSDTNEVTDGDTVTVGSIVYRFKTTPSAPLDVPITGVADTTLQKLADAINRSGVVSCSAVAAHAITITALLGGTAANSTATTETSSHLSWGNTTMLGGLAAETVTIGSTVYTFKNIPAAAYDVQIAATAALTLANLKAAINASGTPGVAYAQGTTVHPSVVGTTLSTTQLVIQAKVPGTAANSLATTETSAHASWAGATMNSGTAGITVAGATATIDATVYTVVVELSESFGAPAIANEIIYGGSEAVMLQNFLNAINGVGTPGTDYSSNTVVHPTVFASTVTATVLTIVSKSLDATTSNAIATTETMANTAFGDTTLGGGTGTSITGVDGETFTIGTRVYTFVDTLSETFGLPAEADQVLWVTSDAVALDNMKKAINDSGIAGTDYSTGTSQNYDVIATTNTNTQQTIVARIAGASGNAIATTTTAANGSWTSTTMTSGAGSDSTVITSFTLVAGTMYRFADLAFSRGLYLDLSTTGDVTVMYD